MDNIHTLLIMEDDLNDEPSPDVLSIECNSNVPDGATIVHVSSKPGPSGGQHVVDWYVCGHCKPMPQEVENKCCKLKGCITTTDRFAKLCLDQDVLELCCEIWEKFAMIEKTIAQDLFARLHTDSLTWPGMDF